MGRPRRVALARVVQPAAHQILHYLANRILDRRLRGFGGFIEMHGGGQVGKLPRIAQREVIRPELMAGEHQQALQRPSRFLRTARSARIALSSEDAQKAILRQRAGRPALPKGGGFQMAEGRFGMEDG